MLPWRHVAGGIGRWVEEAAGLGAGTVVWEEAARGIGVAGPSLRLQRLGVRWGALAAARLTADGAPGWDLDFTGFTPGDPVTVYVFGEPLLVETDPGDSADDARDKWLAAFADLWLGEVASAASTGVGLAEVVLEADAGRGVLELSAGQGVAVTPRASTGGAEAFERPGRLVVRVWGYGFPAVWQTEATLGRIAARVASARWSERARRYLCGATGAMAAVGDVTPVTTRNGAEFDTRAWLDLEVALVNRGGEDADTLSDALLGTVAVFGS